MQLVLADLPDYDFIPAPLWVITVLHVLTLTLHFLAMNFLVGGVVIALMGKFEDRWANPTVQKFVKLFPSVMSATVTLGVAPLLFAQLVYGGMIYSASIVSGWLWILIPIVAMVVYYFLYGAAFAPRGSAKIKERLIFALLGLIFVSLVYSSVFSLAERPALQEELYAGTQTGAVVNTDLGAWIPRWLHMITGAITVGAFFFGWLGHKDEEAWPIAKRWFIGAFIVASVLGIVYLLTLGDLLKPFMQSIGIWVMTAGVIFGLGSLHFFMTKKFVPAAVMMLVSMLGMVASRHALRDVALEAAGAPQTGWRVEPQWGVFLLFVICFEFALALVAWMLKLFLTDRGGADAA